MTIQHKTTVDIALPHDSDALLAGRVWRPDVDGPSVVAIRGKHVFDITSAFPTMRDLCEQDDPAGALRNAKGEPLGAVEAMLSNTPVELREFDSPWILAPIDLQAVKAAGVTFVTSMLERVIEERARGNPQSATEIRKQIDAIIGTDLSKLKPGSKEAQALKEVLIAQGTWSQYLEVGIGPDAEIFTKAQPMSSVGTCMDAGIHPISTWNNPEPEVVLIVTSQGKIVGATLGNDVNLRDVEGRSALLLSKAKDNNASCAIGPFIRFFDGTFTLDTVRTMHLDLVVEGEDGFVMKGSSNISKISRDPADLVSQLIGKNHYYPDGAVLFLGTLFAPIEDRDAKGMGFTHKIGDIVTISTPELGSLVNRIKRTDECEPWAFGASHLMKNLAGRDLL